ncbi:P-loop containing nucleoside triphosphate hydrolase protein [Scleroderma yunnanense]
MLKTRLWSSMPRDDFRGVQPSCDVKRPGVCLHLAVASFQSHFPSTSDSSTEGFLSDLPALAEQSNSRHPNYLRQSAAAPLDPIGTHYRENDLGDDQSEVALPMNEVAIDENDIIIVVLGPTGAGKSTFINLAVGRSETSVGHGLVSCTEEIRPVRYPHPDGERNFVLIDTPGFNNSHKSHIQVLQIIADWLKTTYKQKVMLSGLLYLHRISDNRMAGTPLSNLNMFKRLCGENNFKNIVLVTTMWDEVSEDVGLQREEELNMSFWEVMIRLGSTTRRFNLTKESAWDIINIIAVSLPEEPRALLIQDEMVNAGKPVYETSAGKVLRSSTDSLDITGFFKLSGRKFGGHMDDKDKVSWRYRLSRWLWPSSISSHSMNDSAPLRRAITALRLAQNAAKFINIHLLTEVIASSLNIAQALEVIALP